MRKRQIDTQDAAAAVVASGEIDCTEHASIAFSSEDPSHPIDCVFDGRHGPGAPRWISARPDMPEQVVVAFDEPQSLSRVMYEVEERERERTQEIRLEVSHDEEQSYRPLLVQEYTFSPRGATFQKEDLRLEVQRATHLRVTIVPNKCGSGRATLTSLRLFA